MHRKVQPCTREVAQTVARCKQQPLVDMLAAEKHAASELQYIGTRTSTAEPLLCNRNCYYPCSGRLDITLVTHTSV
jgi:hypothetical protein